MNADELALLAKIARCLRQRRKDDALADEIEIFLLARSEPKQRATASPYDCGGNSTKDYPGE